MGWIGSLHAQNLQVARLVTHPASVELSGAAAEHGLMITAVDGSGRFSDITRLARFTSSRPELISVSTNGSVRALADGVAQILIQFGGQSVKIPVTARATQNKSPVSFRQDIEPMLTRSGCNMGACHGKLAGQNGFKLSL